MSDAKDVARYINRASAAILDFVEQAIDDPEMFDKFRRTILDQHELLRRRLTDNGYSQHVRGGSQRTTKQKPASEAGEAQES